MADIFPQADIMALRVRMDRFESRCTQLEHEVSVLQRRCDRLNQTTVKRTKVKGRGE